ncbi:MAG: DNA cytosine methyltransferase [Xenococcaceae cyanobacterium MO_207.B15]|nr:DNA cytosine methyltransferase [Xenococcaceae cyanobacterium MO_207.B15]
MKCVDLFCGCGGLSLGFIKAGFEMVAAIDNWEKALDVYKINFKHDAILYDLKNENGAVEIIRNYNPDILIGGPPCQDFSSAGKRDETQGKADLTYHFANIVCKYRPKWFVMENVERIKKSHILKKILQQLQNHSYGLTAVILNSAYCGVPQARNRFFLIGELKGKHNVLRNIMSEGLSNKPMTMRDYFGNSLGIEYYYRHPRNYSRRGIFTIDEPSPTVRGVNRPVPKGYKKHNADPKNADLATVRPLTTIERSYIQTFSKTFKFQGTKTDLEQMIGNAVPVNLAKFVAKSILQYIENGDIDLLQMSLFDNILELEIPNKPLHRIAT